MLDGRGRQGGRGLEPHPVTVGRLEVRDEPDLGAQSPTRESLHICERCPYPASRFIFHKNRFHPGRQEDRQADGRARRGGHHAARRRREVQLEFVQRRWMRLALAGAGGSALAISRAPALAYHVLQLNAKRPAFTDLKVRQAISCAIDRQEVLDTASLGEGEVVSPATPPYYRASLNDLFCYKKDEAKAKQLLTEAGYPNGFDTEFDSFTGSIVDHSKLAEALVGQLAKVGIRAKLNVVDFGVFGPKRLANQTAPLYNYSFGDAYFDRFSQ